MFLRFLLIAAMLLFSSSSSSSSSYVCLAHGSVSRFPHAAAAAAGRTRKVLAGVAKEEGGKNKEELRTVPSGPDPLHHNGGTPNKKPRPTSP